MIKKTDALLDAQQSAKTTHKKPSMTSKGANNPSLQGTFS